MLDHTIHTLFNDKLETIEELYLSVSLRTLAVSMVSIFFPLYLMEAGYSFFFVIIFYIVLKTTHFLFVTPAVHIASKFGFKHASAISLPVLVAFYLMSLFVEGNIVVFFVTAVAGGIMGSLYWTGYHTEFSKFSNKKHRGEELGISYLFRAAASFLGPIIGGLIILFAGFPILFVVVSLLALAAAIPLLATSDSFAPTNVSFVDIFKGRSVKDILPFLGFGLETTVSLVFWPVFVFSILGNFASLGGIASFALFFAFIVTFVVGKYTDGDREKPLVLGAFATAGVWIMRSVVWKPVQILIVDPLYGLSKTALVIPFNAKAYDNANKRDGAHYIAFREAGVQLGSIMALLLLIPLGTSKAAFAIPAISALLYVLI